MKKSKIYLRIIAMFVIPLIMYQIPQFIRPLLGDWKCQGSGDPVVVDKSSYSYIDHWTGCNYSPGPIPEGFHHPVWHFGFGHYLWILMGLTLFIVQLVFLMNEINKKEL